VTLIFNDLKYAFRMLVKHPGFTAIALITLAVGIGANTVMFSVADLLLLRPMEVSKPEQLACCTIRDFQGGIPYSAYLTIRDNNPVFSGLVAQDGGHRPVTFTHKDRSRKLTAMFVSANYFSLLGVGPIRGRGFLPQEDRQEAAPVAVLSYRLWQQQGDDPNIVGQYVSINGVRCQVIGMAPERFSGVTLIGPDLWLPLGSYLDVVRLSRGWNRPDQASRDWDYPSLFLLGRLRPGLNMEVAQARLQTLASRFKGDYPKRWTSDCSFYIQRPPRLEIYSDAKRERMSLARLSLGLMGVSMIILVIACLNLANMMITQQAGRQREVAIRLAMGGGRLRIIRQLLIESMSLALLAGALGLVLALWGTQILNTWIAASRQAELVHFQTGLSFRVLVATLGFALLATSLFGLKPALGLSRSNIAGELKGSGTAMRLPVSRKRGSLSVLFQITLAVVLVMGAVLFVRSAVRLARPNYGFGLHDKLVSEIDLLSTGHDRTHSAQVCQDLADHLASLPGVEALGMTARFFFGFEGAQSIYELAPSGDSDGSRKHVTDFVAVSEVDREFFAALELPLLQGRLFHHLDNAPDAEKVAIIDERLARKLRSDGKALGCMIQCTGLAKDREPYRVVGIVPHVEDLSAVKDTHAQAYIPIRTGQVCPYFYYRLKHAESATTLIQWISAEVRKVNPRTPLMSISTLAQKNRYHPKLWYAGFFARLALSAGITALFLAALGIYAVKAYLVTSRTHEIGVRISVGATSKNVMCMVFREGIVLTSVGLVVGLVAGLGMARLVNSMLFGVSPMDPISIMATVALLGAASLFATYVPARRAARIDPMKALRYE